MYLDGFFDLTVFEVGMSGTEWYPASEVDKKSKWAMVFGVSLVQSTATLNDTAGIVNPWNLGEKSEALESCYGFDAIIATAKICASIGVDVGLKIGIGSDGRCWSDNCTSPGVPPMECDAEDDDNCYVHSSSLEGAVKRWHQGAQNDCEERGGVLATPTGIERMALIQGIARTKGRAWVGMRTDHTCTNIDPNNTAELDACIAKHKEGGTWDLLGFNRRDGFLFADYWAEGEPDDGLGDDGIPSGQTAIIMGTGGLLNDYPHNQKYHYICNFPKQWGKLILVPTPYTQLSATGSASLGAVGGVIAVDLLEGSFPVVIDLDWVKTDDKYSGKIAADVR